MADEKRITYFPFLGEEGGIALCKEHEEKYFREKTEPLLDVWSKSKSGDIPCKFCLKR
jgi:hypothetical protein